MRALHFPRICCRKTEPLSTVSQLEQHVKDSVLPTLLLYPHCDTYLAAIRNNDPRIMRVVKSAANSVVEAAHCVGWLHCWQLKCHQCCNHVTNRWLQQLQRELNLLVPIKCINCLLTLALCIRGQQQLDVLINTKDRGTHLKLSCTHIVMPCLGTTTERPGGATATEFWSLSNNTSKLLRT
jgi:hypothetical protein